MNILLAKELWERHDISPQLQKNSSSSDWSMQDFGKWKWKYDIMKKEHSLTNRQTEPWLPLCNVHCDNYLLWISLGQVQSTPSKMAQVWQVYRALEPTKECQQHSPGGKLQTDRNVRWGLIHSTVQQATLSWTFSWYILVSFIHTFFTLAFTNIPGNRAENFSL